MTKLHHQTTIHAPLDKVWGVLSNLEEVAHYNRMVRSVKYLSDNRTGIGAARQCDFDKGYVKERVTDVRENAAISIELVESQWPLKFMRWTTEISGDNEHTVMTQTTEYEPGLGLMGKIMNGLVMKRKFSKILDELFIDMKHYIESK